VRGNPDSEPGDHCDFCARKDSIVAHWGVRPFEHEFRLPDGPSQKIDYSSAWGACATCDAAIRSEDREALRRHTHSAREMMTRELTPEGRLVMLDALDLLHDDFLAHKTVRRALPPSDDQVEGPVAEEPNALEMPEPVSFEVMPDVPGMPGRQTGIAILSGINAEGKPFCHIYIDGRPHGQLTPNEVRRMAMNWLEAAEAAEHDSAVYLLLTDEGDGKPAMERETAVAFIGMLRDYRGTQSSTARPEDLPR
jgi:hypothetical protein